MKSVEEWYKGDVRCFIQVVVIPIATMVIGLILVEIIGQLVFSRSVFE